MHRVIRKIDFRVKLKWWRSREGGGDKSSELKRRTTGILRGRGRERKWD